MQKTSKIAYDENSMVISGGQEYWDRSLNNKAASKRNRHIIIFNTAYESEFKITIPFYLSGKITKLQKADFKISHNKNVQLEENVKNRNIEVLFNIENPQELAYVTMTYKHKTPSVAGIKFNVLIMPCESKAFEKYKTKYQIDANKKKLICAYENDQVVIGNTQSPIKKVLEYQEQDQKILIEDLEVQNIINFDTALFDESGELLIQLEINSFSLPLTLHTESVFSLPIKGEMISKNLREKRINFTWNRSSNRLIQGTHEYYIENSYLHLLNWEHIWLTKNYYHAEAEGSHLREIDLKVDDRLIEDYGYFIQHFLNQKTISSLMFVDEEYKLRAEKYIKTYLTIIDEFEEEKPVLNKGMDLFKFATIISEDYVYLTPYHPLMVAYKLELYNLLDQEVINTNMLNRLSPDALLPLAYFNGELYAPDQQGNLKEWMTFKTVQQVSISDANQYLEQVVKDKLKQFESHFSYLFLPESKAPLQINVINISNDFEVVRGLITWIIDKLKKKNWEKTLKTLEVTIYSNDLQETAFDLLSQVKTPEEFEEVFSIKLVEDTMEKEDMMNIIREQIWFYKHELDINNELRYSHITFYKLETHKHYGFQNNKDMLTGISLDGIYNSVPSMKYDTMYKNGFGTKGYNIEEKQLLLNVAEKVNELSANIRDNGGINGYRKNQSTVSNISATDDQKIKLLLEHSNWVTFIDPGVDLEFFKRVSENIVIIHYSDQYSSSSRYDAITVTNKTKQYSTVIKEYLEQKGVESNEIQIMNAIHTFNTFNGEWLLRIIGSNNEYGREKLSLASAIKYILAYFEHKDIMWVPISLEEILRVVGVYNLSKSEGVFTAKNLGMTGEASDDLLLMGLEQHVEDIKIHFYPVEVKIGINNNDVLQKAELQIKKTYDLFREQLVKGNRDSFTTKFYENFFIQLFISNAKKMHNSGLWPEKNYTISDELHSRLLKRDVEFSSDLTKYIGKGAIVSFKKDADSRSVVKGIESNITNLNLTMSDGYSGITQTFEELRKFIQEDSTDFDRSQLLNIKYNQELSDTLQVKKTYNISSEGVVTISSDHEKEKIMQVNEEKVKPILRSDIQKVEEIQEIQIDDTEIDGENKNMNPQNARVLIGEVDEQDQSIYWEYGKHGAGAIANRHLLISGASGNGKTYLMQCLLFELSKQGISSIVLDYTDSFLLNQLDPVFVEALGDRLKQRSVYRDKLPINPFKRYKEDVMGDGQYEEQSDVDVAERVKSIFSAVYDLGPQQENLIYELVLRGLSKYNDSMSLSHLRILLEEEESTTASTTLSKIAPLIDRNPFMTSETIDWENHLSTNGDVLIIQLKGYTRPVQLLILEFILWDLWYFATMNGNQKKPIPIILDEAQNLDHREGSPSAYMLTEGRKFGISGWYATQSLSTLKNDELIRLQNAATKIYFNPPASELNVITKFISNDRTLRDEWQERLTSLQKGQCIFSGATIQEGELSLNLNVKIKIESLEKRIEKLH